MEHEVVEGIEQGMQEQLLNFAALLHGEIKYENKPVSEFNGNNSASIVKSRGISLLNKVSMF